MSEFPNVMAVVEAREAHESKDLWALGDALIRDCGEDGRLDRCAAAIEKKGFEGYSQNSLREIRNAAVAFPRARRHAGISLWAHMEAETPDFMDMAVRKGARRAMKIRDMKKAAIELEKKARQKKKEAAEKKLKAAQSVAEAKAAKEDLQKHTDMPEPKKVKDVDIAEHEGELTEAQQNIALRNQLAVIIKDMRDIMLRVRDRGTIDADFGASLVEKYTKIIEVAQQSINVIQRTEQSGLAVMDGGKRNA